MLLVVLVACGLFGLLAYAVLLQTGLLPGSPAQLRGRGPEELPTSLEDQPLRRYGMERTSAEAAARLGRLPQGCLIAVLLFAAVWFVLWGVVLFLALRILTSPY